MEIVLQYYGFSSFTPDQSSSFEGHQIAYLGLNDKHFLIFELTKTSGYNLYIAQYQDKSQVGRHDPEILELLVADYDKSIPEHRLALRAYLE